MSATATPVSGHFYVSCPSVRLPDPRTLAAFFQPVLSISGVSVRSRSRRRSSWDAAPRSRAPLAGLLRDAAQLRRHRGASQGPCAPWCARHARLGSTLLPLRSPVAMPHTDSRKTLPEAVFVLTCYGLKTVMSKAALSH